MIYRNKNLCIQCNTLNCKTTDDICCECKGLTYNACPTCKYWAEEGRIDQERISALNYWSYKGRLRQDPLHYRGHPRLSCSKCGKELGAAGHHGEVKQRFQPKFWELKTPYKVLCFSCLKDFKNKMPTGKQYTFNKYLKRYNN